MTRLRLSVIAGACALAFGTANTASASLFDIVGFGDRDDILEKLIALDANDIEELRSDFREAQNGIADAINNIADAKEEVRDVPFGGLIAKIAFNAASATVTNATQAAFGDLLEELDMAEIELDTNRTSLGEEEYLETIGAINMIRTEISSIEEAIDELVDALDLA